MAEITYLEDIVEELAEEFNMTKEEAKELCDLNMDYIYHLMQNPEVISISLPNLGTLHMNEKRTKFTYNHAFIVKNFVDIVAQQLELIKENAKTTKSKLVHQGRSYYTSAKKRYTSNLKERTAATKREIFREIEKYQNK